MKYYNRELYKNNFFPVVAPDRADTSLWINQDAVISLLDLDKDNSAEYKVNFFGNGLFLFVIEGKVEYKENILDRRDSISVATVEYFEIKAQENSKLLLIEVPLI